MRKIFLDTNFLMDYLIRPEYYQITSEVLREGSRNECRFVISFLSVANIAYINRKMPIHISNQILSSILESFEVADNTVFHLRQALRKDAYDYEDAIQYHTALSSGCEAIITRNGKDFRFSSLPILTPEEFLMTLQ